MGLTRDDIAALLEAFEQSGWTEMVLSINGTRVELTQTGRPPEAPRGTPVADRGPVSLPGDADRVVAAAPAVASLPTAVMAPPTPAASPLAGPALHEVLSPTVGIFYRAPEPGAPPFAEVGRHVSRDDIVCIVEVMKLMNHVKAGVSGVVREVHVENGTMIEHGQVLFTIEPDQIP